MPQEKSPKDKIFFSAINCFSTIGYSHCTVDDIAEQTGITIDTFYKYYKNNSEILDEIFNFYYSNFNKYRIPSAEVIEMADTRPLMEVILPLFYSFGTEPEYEIMMKITKIIMSLKYENEKAKKIYLDTSINDPVTYLHTIFENLIANGRIKQFDYKTFSLQLIAFSQFLLMMSLVEDKRYKELLKIQKSGIEMFARGLVNSGVDLHEKSGKVKESQGQI